MVPSIAADVEGAGTGPFSRSMVPDEFQQLVSELSQLLGPSNGLDSDNVNVKELQALMEKYASSDEEWSQYAFPDFSRGYTRNLVDKGNGKSNLLVLVWSPGKGSAIHDHADSHCLMKVLRGSLKETRYDFPKNVATPPEVIQETIFRENQVTYMADQLGLHKISNPDPENLAVSLHLYTPPNAAKYGCYIFNEKTGKKSRASQSNFFSEFGHIVSEKET